MSPRPPRIEGSHFYSGREGLFGYHGVGTDGAYAVSGINAYEEYGVQAPGNSGLFQHTGHVRIHGTGLYQYEARAYHPGLGRFLQPDPMGQATWINLYAYVGNDPVNLVDPLGLESKAIHEIIRTATRECQLPFFPPSI